MVRSFSVVCDLIDDGDKFSSLILHDCTNCSNGYIVDPVSIQAANVSCIAIHKSNYTDI